MKMKIRKKNLWWGIIDQLQYLSFLLSNMLQYICIRYFQVILHILYSHDNLQHIKNAPKKPQTKQMLIFPPKFFLDNLFSCTAQHYLFFKMNQLFMFHTNAKHAIKIFVANGTISLFLTGKLTIVPCFKIKIQNGWLTPF